MTDYHRLSAVSSFDLEELESKRAPVLDFTRTVPGLKPDDRLFPELANLWSELINFSALTIRS
jgi:hypothetical protein